MSNQTSVRATMKSKDWTGKNGRKKAESGFAKVTLANKSKIEAQNFVNNVIEKHSTNYNDNDLSLTHLENVAIECRTVVGDKELLDHWLPWWIYKFISNAKSWIFGMYHGIDANYLIQYLSEYTYRLKRRHGLDLLFCEALGVRVKATPVTSGMLFG